MRQTSGQGRLIERTPPGVAMVTSRFWIVTLVVAAAAGFAGGWLARRPARGHEWTTSSGAHLALAVAGPRGAAQLWDGAPLAPGSHLQPLATFPAPGFAALLLEEEGGTIALLHPGSGTVSPGGAVEVAEGGPTALGGRLELGDKPFRLILVFAAEAFSAGKLLAGLRTGGAPPAGSAVVAVPVRSGRALR